jgi:hypothetical protein
MIISWMCQSAGDKEGNPDSEASRSLPQLHRDLAAIVLELEDQCTADLAGKAGEDGDQKNVEADRD